MTWSAPPTSSPSCTTTTSRRSGASARRRPSACTTSGCAPSATWPPCRSTPWCGGSARRAALHLAALARGEDPDPVDPNRPNKSIGHEETFSQDLVDPHELERHVLRMAESVATMLRAASDSAARTITVKVKFKDLSLQTRSHTLGRPSPRGSHRRRWPRRCWRASTPVRASGSWGERVGLGHRGGADQLSFDLGDGLEEENQSATAASSRGTTSRPRWTPSGPASGGAAVGRPPW